MSIIVHDRLLIELEEAEHERPEKHSQTFSLGHRLLLSEPHGCSPDLSSYGSLPEVRE